MNDERGVLYYSKRIEYMGKHDGKQARRKLVMKTEERQYEIRGEYLRIGEGNHVNEELRRNSHVTSGL